MSKMSKTIAVLGVVAGLGVAALPLSSYAAPSPVSKDATVQLTVDETLSLELTGSTNDADSDIEITDGSVLVNLGKADPDGAIVDADLTATVKTNNKTGYNLTLADKDDNNKLVSGTDTIDAGTPAVGTSAWGFKMGTVTTAADATESAAAAINSYIEVPVTGSAKTIVNSDRPTLINSTDATKSGDTAIINFGASVSSAQAAGTYTDVVVVTASVNPTV